MIQGNIEPHDLASRYGGEEFAIILKGIDLSESYKLVESIREKISQLNLAEMNHTPVTISIASTNMWRDILRTFYSKKLMLPYINQKGME